MAKFLIVTLFSLVAAAWGYSAGAPEGVCDDMTPKHPVAPQKSAFPYKVALDKSEVKPGEEVLITVSGKPFKGFFVQVREDYKAVGTFQIPGDHKFIKTVNCHGTKGSGATHKNAVEKKNVELVWKAPAKTGKYTVYVTVALDGGTFWVAKPSGTIKVA
ncbi:putative defense protein Hdd11 [Euwallacea similis]|uniref:putative defense protein Hdd11 n=1 Tax=Euwallacea similis TaxID=1736056 RepID=UPI00344C94CC